MDVFRRTALFSSLPIAMLLGCGTETTEPAPATNTIAAASGDAQSAQAGQPLGATLVVSVTSGGAAVSGVTVAWAVASGGGSVNPATSTTDASGRASTSLTLGASPGANTVTASLAGATGSPVTFTATGTGQAPQNAAVDVGNNFFNPTQSTIASGGTVTWTWAGGVSHNVTFAAGTNSATQTSGTFNRTFPAAGSFDYQCTIHPSQMTGTVVVQ